MGELVDRDPAADAALVEEILAEVAHHRREAHGPILAVTPAGVVATPDGLAALAERAKSYAESARASATRTAYRSDWCRYEAWCAERDLVALPADPATVGLYLADAAETHAPATLTRWLSAISVAHDLAGHHLSTRHPAIRDVLRGVRRTQGVAPRRQAAPITAPVLRHLLDTCAAGRPIDLRDRALLLVGFAAALRQSELVALDVADIAVSEVGLRVMIRRSKADQEGEGQVVGIGRTGTPTCPAAAYEAWLAAAQISDGAVFCKIDRHGNIGGRLVPEGVAHVVRTRAERAGLDTPNLYSGHSLRAGFATAAAAQDIEERTIMAQTRHRSPMMVRRYIREGQLFRRNLSAEIGL